MRIAGCVSGGGSTLESIWLAIQSGELRGVEFGCAFLSRRQIGAYERLLNAGVPEDRLVVLRSKDFDTSRQLGSAMLDRCEDFGIQFIGLYGWLLMVPENVINRYSQMMVNQHPGPLDPGRRGFGGHGMFGMRVHMSVIEFARRIDRPFYTEATAQRVHPDEYDRGEVVGRLPLLVKPHHTHDTLASELLPLEHQLQKQVLQQFADGTVKPAIRQEALILPGEEEIFDRTIQDVYNQLSNDGHP